jgi:HTH-type transcriptional regulator/antitoxin MqsA
MRCPECEKGETVRGVWELAYTFHGRTKIIKKVEGERCPECLDIVMTLDEAERISSQMAELNREVRAEEGEVVSDFRLIDEADESLDFGKEEARTFLDDIPSALSRSGVPDRRSPAVLEKLIELLVRHPELLKELRT